LHDYVCHFPQTVTEADITAALSGWRVILQRVAARLSSMKKQWRVDWLTNPVVSEP